MGIMDKVEEIRKKPEHIRVRYAWFFVAISMIFVITIWIFSISASLQEKQDSSAESGSPSSDILNEFEQGKSSFENTKEGTGNSLPDNGILNNNVSDTLNNARQ